MMKPSFQKLQPQNIVDILSQVYERAQNDQTLQVHDLIQDIVGQLEALVDKENSGFT